MMNIKHMPLAATSSRGVRGPALYRSRVSGGTPLRTGSNVLAMPAPRRGLSLVAGTGRARHLGRKGRQALERRHYMDCAFLSIAMGAAALIWLAASR